MDTSPYTLDHVAIVVPSIRDAMPLYESLTGASGSAVESVPAQSVNVAFVGAGPARIELLEPTQPDSGVARFLERRGPGLHHVAYRVPNLREALARLIGQGMQPIDREPRPGAQGHSVAFLHPKDMGGVLVELVERA